MRISKRIESFTVREFKRLKPEFMVQNPNRDGIFFATPDRLLSVGSSEAHAILEIKNAAYWSKDKRTMAVYQVQWYLFVLGMKFGYICALEQGWKLHVQPIVRDEELIERMKDTAQMFWENHIEPRTPPE